MVEGLRDRGVPAIFGDAARAGLLEHAHLDTARLLIVAAPDAYHARRIVELARVLNPDIDIVARTHNDAERVALERLGVGRALMGERELALGMAHYALVALGRSDDAADVTIDAIRREAEAIGMAVAVAGPAVAGTHGPPASRAPIAS
jgi:CPA2 family monovalent cation:H+ antiporter-2